MNDPGLKHFLKNVLCVEETKEEGGWQMCACPYAPWTHEHGTDRNMSFGIKINDTDKSIFNCFTCKKKGTLKMLLEGMEYYTGENYREEIEKIEFDELLYITLPNWDQIREGRKVEKLGEPASLDYLDIYDPAAGHKYLKDRYIEDWAANKMGLCIDPNDYGVKRILFPVYSPEGGFYGFTGRATTECKIKVRDYFGLPKKHLLLGAHLIDPKISEYIVLVEGLFDYANLIQFNAPVVACMHSGVTKFQANILKDFGLPLYVMLDNDRAGKRGQEQIKKELRLHIPLMKVVYPTEKTIIDGETNRYRAAADPGELEEDQYIDMIDTASLL